MTARWWWLLCALWAGAAGAQGTYAQRYAATCAACHGAAGHSAMQDVPSLGGQSPLYAITQLYLFRAGRRTSPAMNALAGQMSDADLRGFADVIAALPAPPAPDGQPDGERLARGYATAQRRQCLACHGADGAGGKQVPRLAFQREEYLLASLQGFKSARRIGYTQAMTDVLGEVGEGELADLAHFLAHFPAPR
ncbi:MAG: c-type cytochrome [Pseudomonadota bacterium]